MTTDRQHVDREADSHGTRWQVLHQGYFGDADTVRPLVDAMLHALAHSRPTVIADLGGGTGFLLCQLLHREPGLQARLVNVDLSDRQLAACQDPRIEGLQRSAAEVTREELGVGSGTLMLVMRSVLHYFGREGLSGVLAHLRAQMKPGERLVHQTASFAQADEAVCVNRLYERMRTDKWYPTVGELQRSLEETGWVVERVAPAPALRLDAAELAQRYQLTDQDVQSIGEELAGQHGTIADVFLPHSPEGPTPGGFTAWLHYHVFTCRAV
jgi:trans-aconitate methyltransferase